MARYLIQRKNKASAPPRYEFLRRKPTFVPAGTPAPAGVNGMVEGSISDEDRIGDIRWTWQDPSFVASQAGQVSGWASGNEPHDFGRAKAERWAALIEGVKMVRLGDDDTPAPTQSDADAAELAAKRAARKAYRESLAAGGEPL